MVSWRYQEEFRQIKVDGMLASVCGEADSFWGAAIANTQAATLRCLKSQTVDVRQALNHPTVLAAPS